MAKKIKLAESGVIFDQQAHTYHLNGKQLQGVTGILERRLFPDKYKYVSKEKMEAAAEYGSLVHEQIELADSLGVQPNMTEVKNYLKLKEQYGLQTIATEYLVTDGEHYASSIDLVHTDKDGEVILTDTKTTSKFDKESVSWQLSIYAYFFEMMNPDIKVSRLMGNWLRGDIARFIEVERKPTELVQDLLKADINDMPFIWASEIPEYAAINEELIIALTQRKAEIDAELDELKAEMERCMVADGKKSIDTGKVLMTLKSASTQERFDTKKLMADDEDLYKRYLKTVSAKGSLSFKVR